MTNQGRSVNRRLMLATLGSASLALAGCPLSIPETDSVGNFDAENESPSPVLETDALSKRIASTLERERSTRGLSTMTNGAWQIFHGILAYGGQFQVDTPDGRIAAVDYFARGGTCAGYRPRMGDSFGDDRFGLRVDLEPTTKTGQGHRDQWLAVVAQAGVQLEDEWVVQSRGFAIADWLRQAEFDIPLNFEEEFSWTLIPLSIYKSTNHRWSARDGETYSTELLVDAETRRELQASVCGGTHRLIGLAFAVRKRQQEGLKMTEVWQNAQRRLADAIELARTNQNPDGSYSTSYMHRTGWCQDLGEMLGTTGHVLEFIAVSADQETLSSPWVRRTAGKLCDILDLSQGVDLECGVLYHALHGLVEYQRRLET